jgi:hypothetical protein
MHPTTAVYLVKAHHRDLEREAAKARLAADVRAHESDELRPTRWGIRLPHLVPALRRRRPLGAATA